MKLFGFKPQCILDSYRFPVCRDIKSSLGDTLEEMPKHIHAYQLQISVHASTSDF